MVMELIVVYLAQLMFQVKLLRLITITWIRSYW